MQYRTLSASSYLKGRDDINIHCSTVEEHYALHSHDFVEIVFVTSGKGTHIVGGDAHRVERGDLFILNVNVPHEFIADPGAPLTVYNCLFQPASIDNTLGDGRDFVRAIYQYLFHSFDVLSEPRDYIRLRHGPSVSVETLFKEIYDEYQRREEGYRQMVRADLTRLLIYVFRLYRAGANRKDESSLFRRILINTTLDYMRCHYRESISVDTLAALSYLSPGYFSRVFRRETGMTPMRMLQKLRVEKAVSLLENTRYSIDEIATRVGYSDRKYFYEIFRRHTGCTPGWFRNDSKA